MCTKWDKANATKIFASRILSRALHRVQIVNTVTMCLTLYSYELISVAIQAVLQLNKNEKCYL